MRSLRLVASALALVGATACASESTDIDLDLELLDGGCSESALAEISVLSLEVYGGNDDGDMCTLAKRCVFDVDLQTPPQSVADLEAALQGLEQPIIDVDASDARFLAVIGRRRLDGCFAGDEHPVCGFADLADGDDGALQLNMRCEPCPATEFPLCP